ncbi:MAG: hypothetical protein IPM96_20305 [Ignavibacteria bacterium]|nr:hypothetical protein [Ignavibacteria bacterium]
MIARFACIPNRLGIPSVYINIPEEKVVALFEISKIINLYPEIKNIILQEATKETSKFDKISGRLLLENNNLHSSREEVLEIYKGARETGILNKVNVVDNNFLIFEKKIR